MNEVYVIAAIIASVIASVIISTIIAAYITRRAADKIFESIGGAYSIIAEIVEKVN